MEKEFWKKTTPGRRWTSEQGERVQDWFGQGWTASKEKQLGSNIRDTTAEGDTCFDGTQIPDLAELVLFCIWRNVLLAWVFWNCIPHMYPDVLLSCPINRETCSTRHIPPRPQPWTPPKFSGCPASCEADGRAIERIGTEAHWPWNYGNYG